jgi:hypothetical protein
VCEEKGERQRETGRRGIENREGIRQLNKEHQFSAAALYLPHACLTIHALLNKCTSSIADTSIYQFYITHLTLFVLPITARLDHPQV